jgi:hypothetical protein
MRGSYAAPIQVHFHRVTAISLAEDRRKDASVDRYSLGKGLRWAFALEAGAALILYGIWQLWHLWL